MMLSDIEVKELEVYCKESRKNIIEMVYSAQSGHIGGSLSACELLTVLYHKIMHNVTDWKSSPDFENRDRFVLSKGHVSPLLYSVMSQVGYFDKEELKTFRKLGTRLQGHPTAFIPGIEIATGSLGQGLSFACGIAMSLKLDNNPAKVYVLLGDGEMQEGNVWEALMQAPFRKLNNLIAIIDRNRLQIDGNTEDIMALGDLGKKLSAFGWNVLEIDGHDIQQIYKAYNEAKISDKPTVIVANTIKGKGVSFMENNPGCHGTAPKQDDYEKAMKELI